MDENDIRESVTKLIEDVVDAEIDLYAYRLNDYVYDPAEDHKLVKIIESRTDDLVNYVLSLKG